MPLSLTRKICREYIEKQLFEPRVLSSPGAHDAAAGMIGIELEAFSYRPGEINAVDKKPVPLTGEPNALIEVLLRVSQSNGGVAKYWNPGPQHPGYASQMESIEFPNGDRFLFEPGGQVEISTAPCDSIGELEAHLKSRQAILQLVTQENHIHFAQAGTNPWFTADEIGNQLHKPRYHALEKYLDSIGPYGKQMMRQTCALHINIDFGQDQKTRIKRIVAANLLVPFAAALFANSPAIDGKVTAHKAHRSFLWQHLDEKRTGILPIHKISKSLRLEDLIDAYLDMTLKAPVIYIDELGDKVLPKHFTLDYWMKDPVDGIAPTISHLANHLTLLFPEVRLKGYLEIRSVDAPPLEWQLVPVMFYTGLLYADSHLDKVLELLLPLASRLLALYAEATGGLASDELFRMSDQLMKLAIYGFASLPDAFKGEGYSDQLISFYERFTSQRKTFADDSDWK